MITIRLFGTIEVFLDQTAIKIDSRKALALLGYLALAAGPVSRASLLGLLWADMPEDRARANLSWTLHRLSVLLPGVLHADRASIRFVAGENISIDVHAFERLTDLGDQESLVAALELYRGPLLDDLELQGCAEFEHWLAAERERYGQHAAELMQRLADGSTARGSYAEAAAMLARLLARDPLREQAHRQRMRLLAWTNQRGAALLQFEQCRRVLREELGVEPEAETLALAEQIRNGTLERSIVRALEPGEQANERSKGTGVHTAPLRLSNAAPLVGREAELAEVGHMLADSNCRLVTIVGFGGMGKTRLALAAAEHAAAQFRDGAVMVTLAATDAPALLPLAIAEALGIDLRSQFDPQRCLLDLLREREQLLLLDNIEHLLDGVDLVSDILAEAPGVRLLITSQVRLSLREEWVYDLRGLRLPASDDAEVVEQSDAVRLFVRQARRVQAAFALHDGNREAVVRICRAVWGHPLAIEVAASWVRTLSPAEIAAEIDNGAGLLTATVRDLPARHRSAQSVFAYGWARLSAEEQRAFALLSVFPADFSREAAGALLEPLTGGDQGIALALLAALVDKSLLRRSRSGRYVLHTLLRRFAARKLRPDQAEAAYARYWRFFAAFLRSHETTLGGADQESALAAISTELTNIRAGWLWAARQPGDALAPTLDCLLLFFEARGWFRAGADLFAETATRLEVVQADSALLGRVRAGEGMLLQSLDQ